MESIRVKWVLTFDVGIEERYQMYTDDENGAPERYPQRQKGYIYPICVRL